MKIHCFFSNMDSSCYTTIQSISSQLWHIAPRNSTIFQTIMVQKEGAQTTLPAPTDSHSLSIAVTVAAEHLGAC